jgi:hypothetical protein
MKDSFIFIKAKYIAMPKKSAATLTQKQIKNPI